MSIALDFFQSKIQFEFKNSGSHEKNFHVQNTIVSTFNFVKDSCREFWKMIEPG